MTLTVACFYWIDKARSQSRSYQLTPDDVRMWDRGVERSLTVPHRRVCVTHRPDLINFMETIPLDPETHIPGTCLVKLQSHKVGGVAKEGDRVITIDVDAVFIGNIDHLVTEDDMHFWHNPNFTIDGRRGYIQGSIQEFVVGATEFLWSDFDPRTTPSMINRRFGGAEQAWLSERLSKAYPEPGWEWDVPVWTETDGIYGAGRLFDGKPGEGVYSELPENARIVFTPGDRSPSQPEMQAKHPWIKEYYK